MRRRDEDLQCANAQAKQGKKKEEGSVDQGNQKNTLYTYAMDGSEAGAPPPLLLGRVRRLAARTLAAMERSTVPKPYRGKVERLERSCLPKDPAFSYAPGPGCLPLDVREKRSAVPKHHCGGDTLPLSCWEPQAPATS